MAERRAPRRGQALRHPRGGRARASRRGRHRRRREHADAAHRPSGRHGHLVRVGRARVPTTTACSRTSSRRSTSTSPHSPPPGRRRGLRASAPKWSRCARRSAATSSCRFRTARSLRGRAPRHRPRRPAGRRAGAASRDAPSPPATSSTCADAQPQCVAPWRGNGLHALVAAHPHNGSMTQPTTYGGRPLMPAPGAPTPELRVARFRGHARRLFWSALVLDRRGRRVRLASTATSPRRSRTGCCSPRPVSWCFLLVVLPVPRLVVARLHDHDAAGHRALGHPRASPP